MCLPWNIRLVLAAALLLPLSWIPRAAHAAEPSAAPKQPQPAIDESLSAIARRLVVESLPHEFEDRKHWGQTTKIVNGLSLKANGDHLRLEKHTKQVNNGLWKEYRSTLVDPERQLQIRVANLRQLGDGRTSLEVYLTAKLHGEVRLEQWIDGVKTFNVATEADSKVEVRLDCELRWRWTAGNLFGEFLVEPKVTGAEIRLDEFDLKKVSRIEGWAARELGEGLKSTVANELHRQEPKLVEQLNKALQKKQDHLRFSPDNALVDGWSKVQSLLHLDAKPDVSTAR
jgi:hypothetical protein